MKTLRRVGMVVGGGLGAVSLGYCADADFSSMAESAVGSLTDQMGSMAGYVLPAIAALTALMWLARSIQRRGRSGV